MCVSIHTLSTECVRRISEFDDDDYESLAAKPLEIHGYYSYTLPCGGIVTSIEARGFCGRPDNVELRLIIAQRRGDNGFRSSSGFALVPAQCNKTATVGDHHYEGYVSNDSLNFRVEPGHVLAVFLNPDCENEKCYFQPAFINESSNYDVAFADSHIEWSNINTSLFLFVNITGMMITFVECDILLVSIIQSYQMRGMENPLVSATMW